MQDYKCMPSKKKAISVFYINACDFMIGRVQLHYTNVGLFAAAIQLLLVSASLMRLLELKQH